MSRQITNLTRVRNKGIPKAGAVLADAFRHDPVWVTLFEGDEMTGAKASAWYEAPVRYCLKYGEVYASSELLEGVAAWVPGEVADMTLWRALRGGAMRSGMNAGWNVMKRAMKVQQVFEPMVADRDANMEGRAYVYLMIIGVATEFQGQGFGGKLLRAVIEETEQAGIPLYLETETERNVDMYERFGFTVVKRITLPIIDLPMWEMVREPTASLSGSNAQPTE